MNINLIKIVNKEQEYRLLIRNLRKQQEEKRNEKANNKKANNYQSN